MRKNTEDTGRHTDLGSIPREPCISHHLFLVNISPGLLSCLWPTLSMDGFLGKSVCWLMRARYWTIFVKFFSIKLSADVLFLRKVSLEAAISLWIFNWRLNKFFLSQAYWLYIDSDPSQGYLKIYYENASQWSCLVWLANKLQDQISQVSLFPRAECF